MKKQDSSRRDFLNKLAVGSLTGLAAGSVVTAEDDDKTPLILKEPNVCRGLNTCKGKGKAGGEHDCAGQSSCAAVRGGCNGLNKCAGQGGGTSAGKNSCKGKGKCAVPFKKESSWKKARRAFEKAAKEAGMKIGPAPEA